MDINTRLLELLQQLPERFTHEIQEFETMDEKGLLATTIRCNCTSDVDFDKWKIEYEKLSLTTWNVRKTYKPDGRYLMYRKDYVCRLTNFQHVDKKANPRSLARDCKASLVFKVKNDSPKARRKDPYLQFGLCGVIEMKCGHNHPIMNAHALSLLRPTKEVHQKFIDLFKQDHTGPTALNFYVTEIELMCDGDEATLAATSIVPRKNTVNYWYSIWHDPNFGDTAGEKMWSLLEEKASDFARSNGTIVRVKRDIHTVVVLTPIMRRAHRLLSSSEIIFVDSTSSCDQGHHVLTFLFARCPVGAIPIGVIITNGQSEDHYRNAFLLLKQTLGEFGFHGKLAPEVFMTDDSDAERNALHSVWPTSKRLLCIFHVAQAVYRWLRSADNRITTDDRRVLMKQFRAIIYSLTREQSEENYRSAYFSDEAKKYPDWQKYMTNYWKRRDLWCLAHRQTAAIRGSHTNNYVESAIRVFKDIVLTRTKAFNALALVQFVANFMEKYYQRRLRQFTSSHDTRQYLLLEHALRRSIAIKDEHIDQIDEDFYAVKSESNDEYYHIDISVGSCSCPIGSYGAFCKHQAALYRSRKIGLPNMPSVTLEGRHEMAALAFGEAARDLEFYRRLDEIPENAGTHDQPANEQRNNRMASRVHLNEGTENDESRMEPEIMDESEIDEIESTDDQRNNCPLTKLMMKELAKAMNKFSGDGNVKADARLFVARLRRFATTPSQFSTFLRTAGSSLGNQRGVRKRINTQVTSISRRAVGKPRSAARVEAGRPPGKSKSKEGSKRKKRKHALALNIEQNQANG